MADSASATAPPSSPPTYADLRVTYDAERKATRAKFRANAWTYAQKRQSADMASGDILGDGLLRMSHPDCYEALAFVYTEATKDKHNDMGFFKRVLNENRKAVFEYRQEQNTTAATAAPFPNDEELFVCLLQGTGIGLDKTARDIAAAIAAGWTMEPGPAGSLVWTK